MSRKVWYCVNCGYEVGNRGRCFRCRERLAPSPLPELEPAGEDDEVGYRLGDWDERGRGRLIVALIRANVEHRFEEEELVVSADDEARVDDLLAELQAVLAAEGPVDHEAAGEGQAGDGPDGKGLVAGTGDWGDPDDAVLAAGVVPPEEARRDEVTTEAVEELYLAAARLHRDPTDMQADAEVAEASAAVFGVEDFFGLDGDTWSAVGRVTRRLLGALGAEEALEEEIRTQAGVLVKLLGPAVDPAFGEAVPGRASAEGGGGGEQGGPGERGERTRALLAESTAALGEGRPDPGAAPAGPADEAEDSAEAGQGDAGQGDAGQGEAVAPLGDGPAGGGDEIVYELPDWLPDQRAKLSVMLDGEQIAHSWDGGDLVVPGSREGDVDAVFDSIETGARLSIDEEEADEARYHALEELFAAADRLANDPQSSARREAAVDASVGADGPTPVGMADIQWWQLRARTKSLVDAINQGAGTTRVAEEATAVRDLLRAIV